MRASILPCLTVLFLSARVADAMQVLGPALHGKRIRVSIEGARFEGRVLGTSDSAMTVHSRTTGSALPELIRLSTIDSMWVRGRSTVAGAVVGGLVVGVGAVALLVDVCHGLGCEDTNTAEWIGFGAASAGAGALVGGLIGSQFHKWKPFGPLPTRATVLPRLGLGRRSGSATLSLAWSVGL